MLRDKDYVRTKHDLLFNVTGYRHRREHYFGSLKYVGGRKWTAGYDAAVDFLACEHPEFVDGFIQIPKAHIRESFSPTERWHELRHAKHVSPLHREALDLGERLRDILELADSDDGPGQCLGITDSLLWGEGNSRSDIDLVVIGRANADRIQALGKRILADRGFQRPDPRVLRAPYGYDIINWAEILGRKLHMGSFRGRFFSLRAVLSYSEIGELTSGISDESIGQSTETQSVQSVRFGIADTSEALFFPAVYRNASGDELIDYSVVYEGVFRVGDIVQCDCEVYKTASVTNAGSRTTEFGSETSIHKFIIRSPCEWIRKAQFSKGDCDLL